MNTPTRDFLRRPERRRRSSRRALAVIPDMGGLVVSTGDVITLDANAMDNMANSRHGVDSWSPVPSPDELVIQKRGRRRRTIVWSPDMDSRKRDSLFNLSSRDRTPVKSPNKSNIVLRSTPRKRLLLGESNEQLLSTPEKQKKIPSDIHKTISNSSDSTANQKPSGDNPLIGLKGLSHEQLIKMIMNLITMQDNGLLSQKESLKDIVCKLMPIADIKPMEERLKYLRQNISASLLSDMNAASYSRAYVHLDAFQKAVLDQGKLLCETQHWTALIHYVFSAWGITKEIPQWETNSYNNVSRKCFKGLSCFCMQALQHGAFDLNDLEMYTARLDDMLTACGDLRLCLQLAKDRLSALKK